MSKFHFYDTFKYIKNEFYVYTYILCLKKRTYFDFNDSIKRKNNPLVLYRSNYKNVILHVKSFQNLVFSSILT